MTTASLNAPPVQSDNILKRGANWLDERGKGAWNAATVLAFIAYMIWSERMFNGACTGRRMSHAHTAFKSSGNTAFDAYKADTLKRLQDEQDAFAEFLNRLRDAKDKAEFDQFMADRARKKDDADSETVDA